MEGKPYSTRGGAKSRKKKFYERQDLVRKLLHTLAARWGYEFQFPRVEYNPDDPTVSAIEDVEWELIDSLDTLVIHVLAITVPELKRLLDRLELSVDKKPKLAPGDSNPSPRPWQIAGAAGGPPNPRNPNAPTHEDWDAVRDDPALAARLAAYDPDEDDEPRAAGAAASTDPVVIDPVAEGAAVGAPEVSSEQALEETVPEPAAPFSVTEADLVQEADDLPLRNEEAVDDSLLVNQREEVQPEEREQSGQGAAEGAPGEVIGNLMLGEATDQPSSPEEELIDNHPLLDPEPDWEQSGTEALYRTLKRTLYRTLGLEIVVIAVQRACRRRHCRPHPSTRS